MGTYRAHIRPQRALAVTEPWKLWDAATTLAGEAQKWNGHGREKNEIKAAQMFCEITLGQLLGPPLGSGVQDQNSHANLDLPAPRVSEFRRYHGHL
jgi:hypothetical protein